MEPGQLLRFRISTQDLIEIALPSVSFKVPTKMQI